MLKKHKTQMKRKVAKATGIPTTKSGRKRKVDRLSSQAIGWIVFAIIAIWYFGKGG
jgi:hypothetical protein